MVKKHIPSLEELLSTLKKCVQDNKVMPFHRIEEIKETMTKIRLIAKESEHLVLMLNDYDKGLLIDAENIIDEFDHQDCDFYECEDYENNHDFNPQDYE